MDQHNEMPADPLHEIARLFAGAILRLRARDALSTDGEQHSAPGNLDNSAQDSLELGAPSRLSVIHTGFQPQRQRSNQ